ncbi:MAG TPA: YaiI/YqxD family protein, partial [Alphaproteobacteria bacterium]|nr:YaiI/YqxD family protein [Alphaproteobacteria bacterium]
MTTDQPTGPEVLVDADACPVKEEIYKVAGRHGVPVTLVANSYMRFPRGGLIRLHVVNDSFDAADDWIAAAAH